MWPFSKNKKEEKEAKGEYSYGWKGFFSEIASGIKAAPGAVVSGVKAAPGVAKKWFSKVIKKIRRKLRRWRDPLFKKNDDLINDVIKEINAGLPRNETGGKDSIALSENMRARYNQSFKCG